MSGLREAHAGGIREEAEAVLRAFLEDQRTILGSVAASGEGTATVPGEDRDQNLAVAVDRLNEIAA